MAFRLFVLACCCAFAGAQMQQGFGANGQQAPQPLEATLMQVFDKDFDGKVTLSEATQSLDAFAAMGAMGAPPEPGAGPNEVEVLVAAAKRHVPTLFELLDADGSGGLSKKELLWVGKVEKALKSGALRNLTRAVFEVADTDNDETLSAAEVAAAIAPDGVLLDQIVALVHDELPIRKDAAELRALVLKVGAALAGADISLSDGMKWVDLNGNGSIERKEVGKAYAKFKELFLKGTQTLQTMGPMLAMFGAMGGGPGGGVPRGRGGRGGGRGGSQRS